jgi:Bacteriophage HK97-gp10, putative tail-component
MPRFTADQAGIDQLVLLDEVVDAQRAVAQKIVDAAKRIAPRETGAYIRGLRVVEDLDTNRRVTASALAPHSHLVEFGSGPRITSEGRSTGAMPKLRVMARALDTVGGSS